MDYENYTDDSEEEEPPVNCYCQGQCPSGDEYGTCRTKPGGKCFTAVEVDVNEDGVEYPLLSFGCLPPHEMALFQCRSSLVLLRGATTIKCCHEYDFCNKHLLPAIKFNQPPAAPNLGHNVLFIGSMASISISFVILAVVLLKICLKRKVHQRSNSVDQTENGTTINISNFDNVLNLNFTARYMDLLERDQSMGSFASTSISLPGLVQRTISQQIQMIEVIGKGKYGEVWKGKWRGEKVAVKVFHPAEEEYWLRETKIYQTVLMRQENILGFIAADIKGNGDWTQMLLITDYHEKGSLSDYLQSNAITVPVLVKMAKTIASGLHHLHMEIYGFRGKPSIAHGNLTSKTVLVKNNYECCIADLGMAVKYYTHQKFNIPDNFPVKNRYTAPEMLVEKYERNNFESYKMADIYSFSLLLWEIMNRCITDTSEETNEYKTPFQDQIPNGQEDETSFQELLKQTVYVQKIRPNVPEKWDQHENLKVICQLMRECWNSNPSVRLTALRIKKTLFRLDCVEKSE